MLLTGGLEQILLSPASMAALGCTSGRLKVGPPLLPNVPKLIWAGVLCVKEAPQVASVAMLLVLPSCGTDPDPQLPPAPLAMIVLRMVIALPSPYMPEPVPLTAPAPPAAPMLLLLKVRFVSVVIAEGAAIPPP